MSCWPIISGNVSLPDPQSFYRLVQVQCDFPRQTREYKPVVCGQTDPFSCPPSSCSPLTNDSPAANMWQGQSSGCSGSDGMILVGWRGSSSICICYSTAHLKGQGLCIPVASARILTLPLLMLAFPTQEIWSRCSSKFSAMLGKSSINLLSVTS